MNIDQLRIRRWVLAGYWAAIYFLTHWPRLDTFGLKPDWPFPHADKFVHAGFYLGWAALWWWVLTAARGRVDRTAGGWLAAGAVGYALFDEVTQAIVGRQPDVIDFGCDVLGAMTALVALAWWQRRRVTRAVPASS